MRPYDARKLLREHGLTPRDFHAARIPGSFVIKPRDKHGCVHINEDALRQFIEYESRVREFKRTTT